MSDFDLNNAFDKLLDAAIDAHVSERGMRAERDEQRSRADQAIREASDLRSQIGRMEDDKKAVLPKLEHLWGAADSLRQAVLKDGDAHNYVDLNAALKKALDEAGPYCDQIPF